MVDSYKERTNYSSIRMIFSGVACVASTYIYEWLIPITQDNPLSPDFAPKFVTLGLVLGLLFSLPLLITFFGTKEKYENRKNEKMTIKKVFKQYGEVLSNATYRKYYFLNLAGAFVASSILSSMVMFIYLVYGNIENFFLGFSLVFVIVNLKGAIEIGFFPINVVLMKKFNKHRPYIIDIPLIIVSAVLALFVNPNTSVWVFLASVSFLGAGTSCLGFVPMTLLPDLADVDELIYGKRREGINAGLTTMGKKIVSGLAITVFGLILGAFGLDTKDPGQSVADGGALIAIKIMYSVIPIVFCSIMIIISKRYALNELSHNRIKTLIKLKKENGFIPLTKEDILVCEKLTGKPINELWIAGKEDVSQSFLSENS